MPKPVIDALKRHKTLQKQERSKAAELWEDNDLTFPTTLGTLTDPHNFRRSFRRIVEKAGISGSWTTNEMRHTCVSLLYEAEVPLERIADQAGHTDTRMIERTYRHRLAAVDAAVAPMDRLFA